MSKKVSLKEIKKLKALISLRKNTRCILVSVVLVTKISLTAKEHFVYSLILLTASLRLL